MKSFLTILFTSLSSLALCQQKEVKAIKAIYDSSSLPELYNKIPIGLSISYANGEVRNTPGFLRGNYNWNRIKVVPSSGTFQNGYLLLDRKALISQNYTIHLTITGTEIPQSMTADILLPKLESIRFHHYADSLKRGFRYYLNVEGIYSSGKIFPLDTSALSFEVSEGKLLGQDLLINNNETSIQSINATATYKNDERLKALTTIPVKKLNE
ncbi:hypothetical protein [Chitinophaga sancti]|uniref:Uncharacterized protein n=1 Tax=Chitinophaga sancti TaxID=1004 RepID=A0A1K1QBE0_9BACT|nr:hypothetical protein [Chitinophaga sancti]WQD61342.1 hypothetical protein U0033_26020 [Chitinophaga sancti]WQG93105.1 hypothetical protein SR876_16440 [Chitinophaga sancti]SFW57256.1 hypothetical protein SAMN05661012_02655 [Chitinophaga sancti]